MAQFNYQDCVTDNIPGCVLTNSVLVRRAIEFSIEGHGTIQDISLVGLFFDKEILLEWHARVKIESSFMIIRLPVYLPLDEEQAIAQVEKHNKAAKQENLQEYAYPPDSYILIGGLHPCQVIQEDGELYIKKISLWGSQRLVQEFLSAIWGDVVTATLVIIDFYTPSTESKPIRPKDIVWLTNLGGSVGILPIMQDDASKSYIYLHKYEEVSAEIEFAINGEKYQVDCDDENGLFIKKKECK